MASVDPASRHRDALPSISHLDLDKLKPDRNDNSRFPIMTGLNISTAPLGSPNTIYSGPPPPYSCASSTAGSTQGVSGYISPPESTTRRSTRDEKESPIGRKSLPSIYEALADKSMPFSTPLSATVQHPPGSTPSTAGTQGFPEAPKGPSNPFSQPASILRDMSLAGQTPTSAQTPPDLQQHKPSFSSSDHRSSMSQTFAYPGSPRSVGQSTFRPPALSGSSFTNHADAPPARSPPQFDQPRRSFPFFQFGNPPPSNVNPTSEPYQFNAGSKIDDQRTSYPRGPEGPYGDTVKRHLDGFDAELGLGEIGEASARTFDFSRTWAQRYHQGNRTGYFQDTLPGLHEIDDMMRQSHRVMENLNRIRDVVIAQQTALTEHRARLARGSNIDDEFGGFPDEFKAGGFAGGDAKKRRGKAAPPGRCHSCNRAETPEWRRGPDGARTLCNACGLHYAKLTRKMGVTKAAALTGSNLRPKGLDQRP